MLSFLTPTFIIAILIAVSVHEWAHAYIAHRLGDPTAKEEGRLTLNPIAHLDPIGTILFLLIGFGWGKPVPVNPQYFRHYKRDTALTAFAGPLSNLILAFGVFAIAAALGMKEQILMISEPLVAVGGQAALATFLGELLGDLLHVNLILMAFNLLPVAPLDGSKVIRPWIPVRYDIQYEEFMQKGPWILLALIVAGRAFNLPVLSMWISFIITPFLGIMHALV